MVPAVPATSSVTVNQSSAIGSRVDSKEMERMAKRRERRRKMTTSRASMACLSCRKRRVRCEVPQGIKECLACKLACLECFFDKIDERKRPISRAFVHGLIKRITLLQETVVVSPLPTTAEEGIWPPIQAQPTLDSISIRPKSQVTYPAKIQRLSNFDEAPHQSLCSTAPTPSSLPHESHQCAMTPEETYRLIAPATQIYLLDLYWKFFNSVVPVIHRETFEEQQQNGTTLFSFDLLHVCMMALGYRYADKHREDMQRIGRTNGDSLLLMKSKSLLAVALERPPSVLLVAALLLLGDMEWGAGRVKQAWLYGRMAMRTSFDAGLHLLDRNETLPTPHTTLQRTTLSACLVSEIFWANFLDSSPGTLLLGSNPDTVTRLSDSCHLVLDCSSTCTREAQVYRELFKLMALVNQIQRITQSFNRTQHGVLIFGLLPLASLEDEFLSWSNDLPDGLGWKPENFPGAPFSFFLLHQQYHCAMIHLHHKILSRAGEAVAYSPAIQNSIRHIIEESQKSCTLHALSVSKIFQQHRKQYETQHIFFMAVKHAQAAALDLITAVDRTQSSDERDYFLAELRPLSAAIADMARTYQPAKKIAAELRKVLTKTLSKTDQAAEISSAEQSDASSSRISTTVGTLVHEAPVSEDRVQGLHCSPQDPGHPYKTCRARSVAYSNAELTSPAVSTVRAEDQIAEVTASIHGDQQFPWTPSGTTCNNEASPKDMSSKDELHLAFLYTPQLRDFALF